MSYKISKHFIFSKDTRHTYVFSVSIRMNKHIEKADLSSFSLFKVLYSRVLKMGGGDYFSWSFCHGVRFL